MYYLTDLCYLCLRSSKQLQNINSKDIDAIMIRKKLEYSLSKLKICELYTNLYICTNCLEKINILYLFKKKCTKNISTFKRYLSKLKNDTKNYKRLSVTLENTENTEYTANTICEQQITIKEEMKENESEVNNCILSNMKSEYTFHSELIIKNETELIENEQDSDDTLHENETRKPSKLKCSVCKTLFSNRNLLRIHLRRYHPKPKTFECKICGAKFSYNHGLMKHLRRCHSISAPYECKFCSDSFEAIKQLAEHISKVHSDKLVKNYTCHICGKVYSKYGSLSYHLKGHSKKVECPICGKQNLNSFGLKSHISKKHVKKSFKEKSEPCQTCGKIFSSRYFLKQHEILHSDPKHFACKICGKKFPGKLNLKQHNFTHSNTKEFQCHICGKSFGFQSNLCTHKKVHLKDQKSEEQFSNFI